MKLLCQQEEGSATFKISEFLCMKNYTYIYCIYLQTQGTIKMSFFKSLKALRIFEKFAAKDVQ